MSETRERNVLDQAADPQSFLLYIAVQNRELYFRYMYGVDVVLGYIHSCASVS